MSWLFQQWSFCPPILSVLLLKLLLEPNTNRKQLSFILTRAKYQFFVFRFRHIYFQLLLFYFICAVDKKTNCLQNLNKQNNFHQFLYFFFQTILFISVNAQKFFLSVDYANPKKRPKTPKKLLSFLAITFLCQFFILLKKSSFFKHSLKTIHNMCI